MNTHIYNYDQKTKELLGQEIGILDPIDKNIIIPANSTDIVPLKAKKGFAIIFDIDKNKWFYIPNNRGKIIYKGLENKEMNYLGDVEEGWFLDKPKELLLLEAKEKKTNELKKYLDTIVMKINDIPVWFNSDDRNLLVNACNNAKILGMKDLTIILRNDVLLVEDKVEREELLKKSFVVGLEEMKIALAQMDIYAGKVKLVELAHENFISYAKDISEIEGYDITLGFPETLELHINFLNTNR